MANEKLAKLCEKINDKKILVAPGAYDSLSAKIIAKTGFEVVYFSGSSVSYSSLGAPDIGLISFNEMINQLRNIVFSVNLPVIADGDNGYGNAINVRRTVIEYESAGAAGIQLDDLNLPRKYVEPNKQILPVDELKGKILAANEARNSKEFIIIFRTLSRLTNGLDEALKRAKTAVRAGADVIFIDKLESEEEYKIVRQELSVPLLVNMNEKSYAANFSSEHWEKIGYNIALFPVTSMYAAAKAVYNSMQYLRQSGSTRELGPQLISFAELNEIIDMNDYEEYGRKYLPIKKG